MIASTRLTSGRFAVAAAAGVARVLAAATDFRRFAGPGGLSGLGDAVFRRA